MTTGSSSSPRVPPRWFVRSAWVAHRALYSGSGGRVGLRPATPERWGMLRLHTTGRRSGQERRAILAYLEDGQDLVLMAMNGWSAGTPGWCANLQANPEATVELADGTTRVVAARVAEGADRDRLWARWAEFDKDLDAYATRRSETPIMVLSPR